MTLITAASQNNPIYRALYHVANTPENVDQHLFSWCLRAEVSLGTLALVSKSYYAIVQAIASRVLNELQRSHPNWYARIEILFIGRPQLTPLTKLNLVFLRFCREHHSLGTIPNSMVRPMMPNSITNALNVPMALSKFMPFCNEQKKSLPELILDTMDEYKDDPDVPGYLLARIEQSINLNQRHEGFTALHFAANFNREVVRCLLDKKANIDTPTSKKNDKIPRGSTALTIACIMNKLEIASLLIERGADPNHQNDEGKAPLHYLAENFIACSADKRDAFESLILAMVDKGAALDLFDENSDTPIHDILSAPKVSSNFLKKIYEQRPNITLKRDIDQLTPFQCATKNDSIDPQPWLELYVEQEGDLTVRDEKENNLLHYVSRRSNLSAPMLRSFRNNCPDKLLHSVNTSGNPPLFTLKWNHPNKKTLPNLKRALVGSPKKKQKITQDSK